MLGPRADESFLKASCTMPSTPTAGVAATVDCGEPHEQAQRLETMSFCGRMRLLTDLPLALEGFLPGNAAVILEGCRSRTCAPSTGSAARGCARSATSRSVQRSRRQVCGSSRAPTRTCGARPPSSWQSFSRRRTAATCAMRRGRAAAERLRSTRSIRTVPPCSGAARRRRMARTLPSWPTDAAASYACAHATMATKRLDTAWYGRRLASCCRRRRRPRAPGSTPTRRRCSASSRRTPSPPRRLAADNRLARGGWSGPCARRGTTSPSRSRRRSAAEKRTI